VHILFIDESGGLTPPGKAGPRFFVLGGLVIPEEIWPKMAVDLKAVKKKYSVNGEIKWRYFVSGNNKDTNTLKNLSPQERDCMRIDIFHALAKYKGLRIISVICDVKAAYHDPSIKDEDGLYHRAYKVLTERFQYFCQDIARTSGQRINGLIVCDNRNSREDVRLRNFHQSLIAGDNNFTSKYQNIIEGLFIAPSHYSVGIQFADMVAGAIFRRMEANDTRFSEIIKPLIRTGPGGKMEGFGLIKIPKGEVGR
jgi:extradiol dioxygenase family protein